MSSQGTLRIGQVADRTGTTPRTIRYYEEIGLLPSAPGREPGSHRVYGEDDVERLQELLSLKDLLGISLEELRELAAAETARASLREEFRSDEVSDPRRREILREAIGLVGRQRELLRKRRKELERLDRELNDRRRILQRRLRELERV